MVTCMYVYIQCIIIMCINMYVYMYVCNVM